MDFVKTLKELGVEVYNSAKEEINGVKTNLKKQYKKEKLKKRFNLENPYKFVFLDSKSRFKILDTFLARHAKKYNEDDILVFFGSVKENSIKKAQRIRDLSDNSIWEVIEVVDVQISVSMDDNEVDVPCTATYCKVL